MRNIMGKNIVNTGKNLKGPSCIGSRNTDRIGITRSFQEMPSRTRQSKLLEKKPPPTLHSQRRSQRPDTPSPSRTPGRDKRHIISSLSGSKIAEGDLNLVITKKNGEKEQSVKQPITMSYEKDGNISKYNMSMKRKRMDARAFRSLFKQQRIRQLIPVAIYEESKRSSKFPGLGSGNMLVGDKVDGDVECHQGVAKQFGEYHSVQCDEVVSLSSSEGFTMGTLHSHDEAELPQSKDIYTSAQGQIAGLSEADSLKASANGCTISDTLDGTEILLEGCSGRDTEKIRDLRRFTSFSELNSQSGEHSKKQKLDDSQSMFKLASDEKHCFPGSCGACLKQKRLDHDFPNVELCTCGVVSKKDAGNETFCKDKMGVEAGCKGANISSHEDNHENICDLCKQDGKSLICYGKGCRRCYHLSCLGPPLDGVPSGVWHCLWCVKRKIEYGVHSVSKGIELICDAREVEVSGPKGTQRQKQYLVKYQGLAHVHNDWLPEEPLLIEVPSIIADFNHKNHGVSWNSEWTIPQCLLKKRLLSFSKLHGKNKNLDVDNDLECKHEWLVKWNGLDIENAT